MTANPTINSTAMIGPRGGFRSPRAALWLGAGLLLFGALLQALPKEQAYYFRPDRPLKEYLAGPGDGWTCEDLPLGNTEFTSKIAQEILRLDDFAYRVYRKNGVEFAIYCGFWHPGSQGLIEAAEHNPDLCWTNAGWKADELVGTARVPVEGTWSWPGQLRTFRQAGQEQHVLFWHLYGGVLSGYAAGPQRAWSSRGPLLWGNLVRSGFGLRQFEQVFIRISSDRPIEELKGIGEFRRCVTELGRMGLMAHR